jgi:hypothetical protein
MKRLFRVMNIRAIGLLALLISFASVSAKAGGDGYEIYLNNKLILKQYQGQNLSLTSLVLSEANVNDKIVICYTRCNVPDQSGKSRSITLKDNNGNVLKVWTFNNLAEDKGSMSIPVQEILELQKKTGEKPVSIFYAAQDHAQTQILPSLQLSIRNAG